MKAIKHSFFLFLCLLSLANCRRGGGGPMGDGPMGGGPAGQAGPCPKCKERLQEQLARERLRAAPFPRDLTSNINSFDGGSASSGEAVIPQELLNSIPLPRALSINPALEMPLIPENEENKKGNTTNPQNQESVSHN